ncbi:hypothetical protein CK203_050284 [Vitis vinifera]|uniref:Uncharacterized protein n=1 Tax=Vitis vinifera TaxID=29760 RepID=A0A438GZ43_VITVI|nr:hypothetical protein CK203_050284 [Vitis vinifera]
MLCALFYHILLSTPGTLKHTEAGFEKFWRLITKLKNLPPIRQMFDLVIQVNVKSCSTSKDIEDRITEELGFYKCSRGEAEQLLRSQNFLILLDDFHTRRINLHELGNGWWNSDNTQKIVLKIFWFFSGASGGSGD